MNRIAATFTEAAAAGLFLITALATGSTLADDNMKSASKGVTAHSAKAPSNTPTSDLKWVETPIGAMASAVSGDFTKGAHITCLKLPAGAKTPLHSHSASYVGIVISGNTRHAVKGVPETERILPPGAHWTMPANVQHVSECIAGADCVVAIIQDGQFDFLEAGKKK